MNTHNEPTKDPNDQPIIGGSVSELEFLRTKNSELTVELMNRTNELTNLKAEYDLALSGAEHIVDMAYQSLNEERDASRKLEKALSDLCSAAEGAVIADIAIAEANLDRAIGFWERFKNSDEVRSAQKAIRNTGGDKACVQSTPRSSFKEIALANAKRS